MKHFCLAVHILASVLFWSRTFFPQLTWIDIKGCAFLVFPTLALYQLFDRMEKLEKAK